MMGSSWWVPKLALGLFLQPRPEQSEARTRTFFQFCVRDSSWQARAQALSVYGSYSEGSGCLIKVDCTPEVLQREGGGGGEEGVARSEAWLLWASPMEGLGWQGPMQPQDVTVEYFPSTFPDMAGHCSTPGQERGNPHP